MKFVFNPITGKFDIVVDTPYTPSKTTIEVDLTTTDNQTFNLSPAVSFADMEVYRGGARIFSSNGDFTPVYTNGLVSQIVLSSALAVGESLNVIGKI